MKKLLFDGNGIYCGYIGISNVNSDNIKPVKNWHSVQALALAKELTNNIAIHKGLCESWFLVKRSERKYVEEAILDKEIAIEELIAKIVEHNRKDR